MARHIPFAAPVNASEKWAFDFLREQLPGHYDLLTNVELVGGAGSIIEIDAIVIGDWAVYLIDVKGYTGKVEAGRHVWYADGQAVENPLPKLNKNSKVFAGRLRRKIGPAAHTPWIHGLAFVTGSKGSSLHLVAADEFIAAYTSEGIIAALTEQQYIPLPKVHRLQKSQKIAVLQDIGQVTAVERRAHSIGDFEMNQKLFGDSKFSIWTATFNRYGLEIPYLLKCIERGSWSSEAGCENAVRALKREFRIYQELTGAAGVPYVAPLIDTGEHVVLPIKHPRGKPISTFAVWTLSLAERLAAIRSAAMALETIHSRGVFHGNICADNMYMADDLSVELLDFGSSANLTHSDQPVDLRASDISSFAKLFSSWIESSEVDGDIDDVIGDIEGIRDWFSSAEADGSSSLAVLESLVVRPVAHFPDGTEKDLGWEASHGAVINQTYELTDLFDRSDWWSTWSAKHLLGNFNCMVRVYDCAEAQIESAQREFEILSRLHHPGLNRTFDMGRVQGSDTYFMSMVALSEPTLRELIEDCPLDDRAIKDILSGVCNTLEYLHKSGVTHRNISPDTIVVTENDAVLKDLSALPSDQTLTGDVRYKWSGVIEDGWSAYADLYSLAVTVVEAWTAEYPLTPDGELSEKILNISGPLAVDAVFQATLGIIRHQPVNIGGRYLSLFCLAEKLEQVTKLPPELITQFDISKGYMTFLILDMLNDPRPKSRNQWVLGALRSRNIPGNKTNKGSMSATVSRLKAAGVAEYHGKKVRLTQEFQRSAERFLCKPT